MNASPTSNPYRFSGYDFLAFSHAQVFHQSHSGVQTERHPAPDARREREYVSPEVNIFETKEGYVLEAEMPGVNKEGLEITLEGNEIPIVGHHRNEVVTGSPLFRERALTDYRHVFELDPAIDTARITAKVEQGVLSLTLPKSERVKPRKINVD